MWMLKETFTVSRPKCCRQVASLPRCSAFAPIGVPTPRCREIVLAVDELEAIRLADLEGLYQEQAAGQMNVSRQTFGRIVESARRKVAMAIAEGWTLKIEGGRVRMAERRTARCGGCRRVWEMPSGAASPAECPHCHCREVHCTAWDEGVSACRGRDTADPSGSPELPAEAVADGAAPRK